ncbi:unnamed protein product, partial [Brassica oleracea var. botrytis]
ITDHGVGLDGQSCSCLIVVWPVGLSSPTLGVGHPSVMFLFDCWLVGRPMSRTVRECYKLRFAKLRSGLHGCCSSWRRDNSWNRRIVRQPVQQRDHSHSGSSGESWNRSSGDSTKDCSFGEAKSTGQEQTNSILYGSARCWIQILWRWSQDTHVTTKKTVACDTNEQQSDPISVPGHVRLNVAAPRIKMLFD